MISLRIAPGTENGSKWQGVPALKGPFTIVISAGANPLRANRDVTYRCYFLDPVGHIEAAENIEAERLDDAIERAIAMLDERSKQYAVEIWQVAQRLYSSYDSAALI